MALDNFRIEVEAEAVIAWLDEAPDRIIAAIQDKAIDIASEARDRAQQIAPRKSGALGASITAEVETGTDLVFYTLATGVPYGPAQEYGARTPPHEINALGKVMVFEQTMMNKMSVIGDFVFATRVMHPGGEIRGQHFMETALNVSVYQFEEAIQQILSQELSGGEV